MNDESLYMDIDDLIDLIPEESLIANGFEEAILGYVINTSNTTVLYDFYKCVDVLMARDGMTSEEAIEFMDFNVLGAYMGEGTPSFAFLKKDLY